MWLDASGEFIEISDWSVTSHTADGHVEVWYDQSPGPSNNATQTDDAKQPLIVNTGSVVLENGKPAINADGTNVLQTATGAIGSVSALSAFSVLKYNVTGANNDMVYGITSNAYGGADDNFFLRQLSGNFEGKVTDATQVSSINLSTVDTSQYLFSHIFVGGSKHELVKNGASTSDTTNIPNTLNLSQELEIFSVLGTLLASDIKLQELIFFSSDQSSNRLGIESNINAYYSIYTPNTTGSVAKWYDQSGNDNHAVQTSEASQPLIVHTGSIILENGKPAWIVTGKQILLY
jgi:hypothetical protein